MSRYFALLAVLPLGCGAQAARPADPPAPPAVRPAGKVGTFPNEEITVKGQARQYRLVVPESVDGSKPVPLACDRSFLRDFVEHVERGRAAPIDTKSTLDLTRACLLARQSADEGRTIEF